jgi:hypothetical protein
MLSPYVFITIEGGGGVLWEHSWCGWEVVEGGAAVVDLVCASFDRKQSKTTQDRAKALSCLVSTAVEVRERGGGGVVVGCTG